MQQITNEIFVGKSEDLLNEDSLIFGEIGSVIVVASDYPELPDFDTVLVKHQGLVAGPGNSTMQLDKIVDIISKMMLVRQNILIVCHTGRDRSPIVAACLIAKQENTGFDEAWKKVRDKLEDTDTPVEFASEEAETSLIGLAKGWSKQLGYGDNMVSIVMPVYKQPQITLRCLESIEKYTLKPYEIIGVDDGSNDPELSRILNEHCQKIITHKENMGIGQSRADGVDAAEGNLICQIDNDAVFFSNWLFPLIESLNKSTDIAIVGPMISCQIGYFANRISTWKKNLAYVADIPTICMLYHGKLVEQIGNFDPELYNLWSDKDFCYRLTKREDEHTFRRKKIAVDDRVVVYHDGDVDSETGEWKMRKSNTRSFPELQRTDKQQHGMSLIYERWGIRHPSYVG